MLKNFPTSKHNKFKSIFQEYIIYQTWPQILYKSFKKKIKLKVKYKRDFPQSNKQ